VDNRIDPIRSRSRAPEAIPAIRRPKRSGEEREQPERDADEQRRRPPQPPPPSDDGLPHVDVRV
jgi:hypothetical protein